MRIRNIEFQRWQLRWVCILHAGVQTPRQYTLEEHQTVGFGPENKHHALAVIVSFWRAYRNMVNLRRSLTRDANVKMQEA